MAIDANQRTNLEEAYEHRVCLDCRRDFVVTVGEAAWFQKMAVRQPDRRWRLPQTCPYCRRARREARRARENGGRGFTEPATHVATTPRE